MNLQDNFDMIRYCIFLAAMATAIMLSSCGSLMGNGYGQYAGGMYNYNSEIREKSLFLTDKMAYELNLSSRQMDAVYKLNFEYIAAIKTGSDLYGNYWKRRNEGIKSILDRRQYDRYTKTKDFYSPAYWANNTVGLDIYNRYTNPRQYYMKSRPSENNANHGSDRPNVFK